MSFFFINFNIVTVINDLWIKHLEQSCDVFGKCFHDQSPREPDITLRPSDQQIIFDDTKDLRTHLFAKNTRSINRPGPESLISKFVFNDRGSSTSWSRDTFT